MTISLCMIVKPENQEAGLLDRCLESVRSHVDEAIIVITGRNPKCQEVAKKHNAEWCEYEWNDDFAAARNFSFSKATGDYIFWCDADDVIQGAENFKKIIESMEEAKVKAAAAWYMYAFNKYGDVTVQHLKTRIVKNDGSFVWHSEMGEVHEDLQPTYNCKQTVLSKKEPGLYFEVHHKSNDTRIHRAAKRNYRIAKNQVEKYKNDPRALWNLANSSIMLGKKKQALKTFEKFVQRSGSEEERYLAKIRMAHLAFELKLPGFMNHAFQAIMLRPDYPDAWVTLGTICYAQGQWDKARSFLITGLTKDRPEHIIVFNPRDYDENPLKLLANCYFNMGKPDKALAVVQKVKAMFPKDEGNNQMEALLQKVVDELKEAEAVIEKAEKLPDDELRRELAMLPLDMQMHPKICMLRNMRFADTSPKEKRIDYYCGYTNEVWGPDSVKSGIGGSEEAVINLTKRWAAAGYTVHVYNNCGSKEFTNKDGVTWHPYWAFNPRSTYDNLILWRSPALCDHDLKAANIMIDVHDVLPDAEFTQERLRRIDSVCVKTEYHASLFPSVPKGKIKVIGNGIDFGQFDGETERVPRSMIYTSSPDRGLVHLLEHWPRVRSEVPDATLNVYYGWGVFDSMYSMDPQMQAWKKRVINLMKQPGITNHGRVGHKEIAEAMKGTDVFAYPCHFEEIFCISAVKAQAAGCRVLATRYAALPEVVKEGVLVEGDVKGEEIWPRYIDELITILKTGDSLTRTTEEIKVFSWDNIANQWLCLTTE